MSERSTKVTRTITDVRIVPVPRVLIPISEIKTLQIMRFISYLCTLIGGVIAGNGYPSGYFWFGLFLIIVGLAIEYKGVHKAIDTWAKSEPREINYNDTVMDTSEFE